MEWALPFVFGYVALLSGTIGALLHKKYAELRRDAAAYRRLTAARSHRRQPDALESPEDVARAIEAIALEVERISEGQRFLTKLLAGKRRPDGHVSPLSPIPGLGQP
jgi:hypothetical protein